ncbi:hypothetical protein CHARACLAT_020703 [Characodon lateralis]|uniref:Uncharacterized protein n=1 Tax=Characodon lateralis TaxID=208331 RepID=A0ABU7EKU5_9TELE|nr:hypothetical protein [Characodon lateralis]
MDSYCDSWDNFRKVFPLPLVCSAPECLLQCTTHTTLRPKKRRRGTRAGILVKRRRYRRLASWLWRDSRCLRPVPLLSFGVDPAPPSVAQVPWLSVGLLACCPSSVLRSAGGGAVPALMMVSTGFGFATRRGKRTGNLAGWLLRHWNSTFFRTRRRTRSCVSGQIHLQANDC